MIMSRLNPNNFVSSFSKFFSISPDLRILTPRCFAFGSFIHPTIWLSCSISGCNFLYRVSQACVYSSSKLSKCCVTFKARRLVSCCRITPKLICGSSFNFISFMVSISFVKGAFFSTSSILSLSKCFPARKKSVCSERFSFSVSLLAVFLQK